MVGGFTELRWGRRWAGWWVERTAALLSVLGVFASIVMNYNVHLWQASGSDFKTVYAAAWCMARGVNAYSFKDLTTVFTTGHVVLPRSWYAHAPVYPPFTLGLLEPLTALPMVAAVYVWVIACAVVLAAAIASMARLAGEELSLGRPWRLLLIALAAAFPLASFGLEVGNVSVMVAGLCILAVVTPAGSNRWLRAAGLAAALILKPHTAFWVVLALLLMPDRRMRGIAIRACTLGLVGLAVLYCVLAWHNGWEVQLGAYRAMLHSEVAGGSMNAGNRELMGVGAQITSLQSLVGYFTANKVVLWAGVGALLLAVSGTLVWSSLRAPARDVPARLMTVAAWCSFGLIATYHRAHDGTILLLVLPWAMLQIHKNVRAVAPWCLLVLGILMSAGLNWQTMQWLGTKPGLHGISQVMLYRQAPLAMITICGLLVAEAVRIGRVEIRVRERARRQADEVRV